MAYYRQSSWDAMTKKAYWSTLTAMVRDIAQLETVFDSFCPSLPEARIRDNRLERMVRLLDLIGHPEESYKTYHTAGSKGKGTTSMYLASLLEGAGRRCGLYTSPHMYTIRERFMLPSGFFSDELYTETASKLLDLVSSFTLPEDLGSEKPTTFEMYTAYGYMLFREAGCTDAVIETGLGGRLDATNTITPEAVILTPIELEHTQVLGDTIAKIALEKAKIIRPGVPVFVSRQRKEAMDVFRKEAMENNATFFTFDDCIKSFSSETTKTGEKVSFSLNDRDYSLMLSMTTEAMAENAALAVLIAEKLGILTDDGIRHLEEAVLPGRFEKLIIDGHTVIADGAHTVSSVRAAKDAFLAITDDPSSSALIFASIEGKDIEHMAKELFPPFRRIAVSRPGTFKKSDINGIYQIAKALFPEKDIELIPNPDEALEWALDNGKDILVTGSFYLPPEMEKLRRAHES